MNIWNYITIASALIVTGLILIQTRGASLGAGLGGAGEVNTVRRGSDKSLHQLTIIMVVIFAASILITSSPNSSAFRTTPTQSKQACAVLALLAPCAIFSCGYSLTVFKYGSVRCSERKCTWGSSAKC
jgi:protein translocase SecG subunit